MVLIFYSLQRQLKMEIFSIKVFLLQSARSIKGTSIEYPLYSLSNSLRSHYLEVLVLFTIVHFFVNNLFYFIRTNNFTTGYGLVLSQVINCSVLVFLFVPFADERPVFYIGYHFVHSAIRTNQPRCLKNDMIPYVKTN